MSKPPKKYALVGTSCVGKTTLLSRTKAFLNANDPRLKVAIVPEAARIYFSQRSASNPFSYLHQKNIQDLVKEFEDQAEKTFPDIILCDRSVIDAVAYVKATDDEKGYKALVENVSQWLLTYTHFFLLDPRGVPYETDDIRKENLQTREKFHKGFLDVFLSYPLPYSFISGTLDERLNKIVQIIYSQPL